MSSVESKPNPVVEIIDRIKKILYDIASRYPELAVTYAIIENRGYHEILRLIGNLPKYSFVDAKTKISSYMDLDKILTIQEQRELYSLVEKLRQYA